MEVIIIDPFLDENRDYKKHKFEKGDIIGHKDWCEFQNYIIVGVNENFELYLIKEFGTNKWVECIEEIDKDYIKIGEITKWEILE